MSQLIQGLLELSRLSRTELRREKVDLTAIARNVFRELAAGDSTHDVRLDVQEDLTAMGDSAMIVSLLQNLLGNAWKFTRNRPQPWISVSARRTPTERVFEVRDNGVGFNMQHAGRLFGVFQRLHDPSTYSGTGIGLATCKRIVERHGGRIWAESEEGRGTVIFFTIAGPTETTLTSPGTRPGNAEADLMTGNRSHPSDYQTKAPDARRGQG